MTAATERKMTTNILVPTVVCSFPSSLPPFIAVVGASGPARPCTTATP